MDPRRLYTASQRAKDVLSNIRTKRGGWCLTVHKSVPAVRIHFAPPTTRYGPSRPASLSAMWLFWLAQSLGLRLSREQPASEEKTLRGSDERQSRVRVTEPGAELR